MSLPPSGPHDAGAPSFPAGPPEGWPPAGWPGRGGGASVPPGQAPLSAPTGPVPAVSGGAPQGWPPPSGWPGGPAAGRRAIGVVDPSWTPGRLHWGDALVVLVYGVLMVLGLGYFLAAALGLVPRDPAALSVVDAFAVNLLSYGILVVLVLLVAWRPLVASFRLFRTGTWWKLLLLPATWFACIVVNVLVLSIVGEAPTSANQAALEEMTTQAPPLLMALMTVVAAPLVEEYLFRHLLVGKLSRWVNVWVCGVVSVLAFTLLHFLGTGGRFDPVETVPYLTLAVAITVSYILMGRSLAYSVLLHMVNNAIALAMLYLVAPLLPQTPAGPVTPTVILPWLGALVA